MKKVFYIVFLVISGSVFGQEINELDKLYQPPKNSVLDGAKDLNNPNLNSPGSGYYSFAFKFNPGLLFRKIVALNYEKYFKDVISVSAGLGLTFGYDLISQIALEEGYVMSDKMSDLSLTEINRYGVPSDKKHLFFQTSLKFFYESFWFDDLAYVEVGYRRYANTLTLPPLTQGGYSGYNILNGGRDVTMTNNCFMILFGRAWDSGSGKTTIFHDLFYGFGLNSTRYDLFREDYSSGVVNTFIRSSQTAKAIRPSFYIGYVFGFGK